MTANSEYATRAWLAFTFSERCQRTQTSVLCETFPDAARTLWNASLSDRDGFDTACIVLCAPCISPSDLKEAIANVAAVKLPWSCAKLLYPAQRLLWNVREPGA